MNQAKALRKAIQERELPHTFVEEHMKALHLRTEDARYKSIVERFGCPLPLPPNRSAWQGIKYNFVVRKLSMKTGITLHEFNFGGQNLLRLIERFGEKAVVVLQDPDDLRWVYVIDGDELVELTNQATRECTSAYSFAQAKEHKALLMGLEKEVQKSAGFPYELHAKSIRGAKKASGAKKAPNRAQKKKVVAQTKARGSIDRSSKHPLPPSKPDTTASNASVPM